MSNPEIAVVIVDRAEGNSECGTSWQDTYVASLDCTLRDVLTRISGTEGKITMPRGRVTITLPIPPADL